MCEKALTFVENDLPMDPIALIEKYYDPSSEEYRILLKHSLDVTDKALRLAGGRPDLKLDLQFIEEAAMLHDIGICKTFAPDLHCDGEHPYICHGYLGSEMVRAEGYPLHALVCERHTGTGLSLPYIIKEDLPLPHRDMLPVSLEEQVICFADKFYSKTHLGEERSVKKARCKLEKYGEETLARFDKWVEMFL